MDYKECGFYFEHPKWFNGCPGLDVDGDDEECGNCIYRLENIIRHLTPTTPDKELHPVLIPGRICPECGMYPKNCVC